MPLTSLTRRGTTERVSTLLVIAAMLTAGREASADEKEVCVRAVERAQVARLDGKLRKAREGFVVCARPVCPEAIRQDCTRWVGEVDASLPSVVFEAVWADGHDVTGMTVRVDGQLLAGADAGRAVTLDPGEHAFRFEVNGAAPVDTRNVIREGEKNRILQVTFTPTAPAEAAMPASTSPAPAAPATPSPPAMAAPALGSTTAAPADLWRRSPPEGEGRAHRPIPVLAWVLGGVGLVGLGSFAILGLSGTSQLGSLRSTCMHTCNPSDVSSARNEILVGDILGFVGLAASGIATWLVLTRPTVDGVAP
jgi:hypothetical protein